MSIDMVNLSLSELETILKKFIKTKKQERKQLT